MSNVETVYIKHSGTVDAAQDIGDKVEAVGGPVTLLGGRGLLMIRNSSTGGEGVIMILRKQYKVDYSGFISTMSYAEGREAQDILWSCPVRMDGTTSHESTVIIVPWEISTKRKLEEGDEISVLDDGTNDDTASFALTGKLSFLSRGGHVEEST